MSGKYMLIYTKNVLSVSYCPGLPYSEFE